VGRDVALAVERHYLGALIAERRADAARLTLAAHEARHVDAVRSVQAGFAVGADRAASRAAVLDARQAVVAAENAAEDARGELALLVGLDPETPIALVEPAPLPRLTAPPAGPPPLVRTVANGGPTVAADDAPPPDTARLATWLAAARAGSPEARAARAGLAEASAGVAAARAAWIPDVALYGQLIRQNLTPIVGREVWTGGVRVAWTAWDFGRRGHETDAAVARRRAAAEHAARVDEELAVAVRRAWRAAVRAERLVDAADAAAAARGEAARLAADRAGAGLALVSARQAAEAARADADAERHAAALAARLARAELRRLVGETPP
jgi:outer membrane protein TolC